MKKLFKTLEKNSKALPSDISISSIEYDFFTPTKVHTLDNKTFYSACLNCNETPCMFFNEDELKPTGVFKEFPYNRMRNVCPTESIYIDETTTYPTIKNQSCIGCTLCVSRCPVYAIYIDFHEGIAKINYDGPEYIDIPPDDPLINQTIDYFKKSNNTFSLNQLDTGFLANLFSDVDRINRSSSYFENFIIRNLLLQLEVPCQIRPVGNQDIRMDLYFEKEDIVGVGEIDFSRVSIVDNPRTLLDDIAVLVSRHGIDFDIIEPYLFCNHFANKRTEFYELVDDILKVIGKQIHTLSLLALLYIYWHGLKLSTDDLKSRFIAKKGKEEIESDTRLVLDDDGSSGDEPYESDHFKAMK